MEHLDMIKKLIYILLFLPIVGYGQWNFFWSHNSELRCIYDNTTYVQKITLDDSNQTGLQFKDDGTRFYTVGTGRYVSQYDLSIAWDISTESADCAIALENADGDYYGIDFNDDGTKMFVVDHVDNKLEEYDLTIGWDIYDFDYAESFIYTGANFQPYDCSFSPNGKYVIISGYNSITARQGFKQFYLTTAWSTADYVETDYFEFGDVAHYSIQINDPGNALFSASSSNYIMQKTLKPNWGLDTMKSLCYYNNGEKKTIKGIYIKSDYTKMYILNSTDDQIYQYNLLSGVDLKEDLISVWEFDETSGSTAYDEHGSNDGTISGATINQTGKIDKCYDFNDAESDYVTIGNILENHNSDISFSIWFYLDDTNSDYILISKWYSPGGSAYDGDFLIQHDMNSGYSTHDNVIGFVIRNDDIAGTWPWIETSDNSISSGQWYHVVVTVDWGNELKIYLNGSEDTGGYLQNENSGYAVFSNKNFNIGASHDIAKEVDGKIDQPVIYNKVLSSDEVLELYNSGNGKAYSEW
jgi:hypothetical protein